MQEKNQLVVALSTEIKRLQNDAEDLQVKLADLENSHNELVSRGSKGENKKELELLALRQQLDEMKNSPRDESDLEKKTRMLEMTQCHLAESLEHKASTIAALEQELNSHKNMIEVKNEQLKGMQQRSVEAEHQINQSALELQKAYEQYALSLFTNAPQLELAKGELAVIEKKYEEEKRLTYILEGSLSEDHLDSRRLEKSLRKGDRSI